MVGTGNTTYVSVLMYKHPVYVKVNDYKDINLHQNIMVGPDGGVG